MNLKQEADKILYDLGLLDILKKYGEPYPTGGYYMDLLSWRDLDITLVQESITEEDFFAFVCDVGTILKPYYFDGMYRVGNHAFGMGCETNILGEPWNVDIRIRDENEHLKGQAYCEHIVSRVTAEPHLGRLITDIKSAAADAGMYGMGKNPDRHYHSVEIYSAVLDDGVSGVEEFFERYEPK